MKKQYLGIICIYTCSDHEKYNIKIRNTDWYKKIKKNNKFKVLFVYANNSINKKFHLRNDKLILKTKEDYLNLSVKTFYMIKYCSNIFNFKYFIKIDASLIDYKSKNKSLSFDKFLNWFEKKDWVSSYAGIFKNRNVKIESLYGWKSRKNIKEVQNIYKLYPRNYLFNYYSGKAYSLSYSNCKKFLNIKDAINYKNYMYGIEDIMVSEIIKSE